MLVSAAARAGDDRPEVDFFETRIRPVLVSSCYRCHSATSDQAKGRLRLDSRLGTRQGGESGPAVIPGKPEQSLLIQAIAHEGDASPMPPKGKLPAAVVSDFRRWVARGAIDPRDDATPASTPAAPESSLSWWSLRPIEPEPVPVIGPSLAAWARTPIDAFIATKLEAAGLAPAPEADRETLIRRLSIDLLGLPPTPEEVAAYLSDASPAAFERLVDRLLASPHHGERWARHWMDLVHFAETHGHDQDRIRPNAWPYRDYLIEAFNADRPYARFIQEQVAADALFPGEPGLAVALGMIAAGPWDESSLRDIREDSIDRQIGHYIDRDDMVATVMSSFVSMTVHCARCHDHKFDPISQEDYYSLQSDFAGVDRAERAYDSDRQTARTRLGLRLTRAVLPAQASQIELLMATLPAPRLVYAAASDFAPDGSHRPPGGPRPVHMLKRGDIHKPGLEAKAGSLTCVSSIPARFESTAHEGEAQRRAALARWLSDRRNPLTYRSIVNRIWQHLFGRGIVDTPSDFGRMGAAPSHPELLDWLAGRFLDEGGALKRLHRLIVTSAVYRQSSRHHLEAHRLDAENRLLWRQNRRKLDAESVRDSMLLAAGKLDRTMYGPSVRHFELRPGVHVTPVVDYSAYMWDRPGSSRRSVYRFLFRTLPDPFMDRLDAADGSQLTATRSESASALQALALLNNPFVATQCERMKSRLEREEPSIDAQARRAVEIILCREPSVQECRELAAFARVHGLTNLARLLFNSNEFLFVN